MISPEKETILIQPQHVEGKTQRIKLRINDTLAFQFNVSSEVQGQQFKGNISS